MIIGKTDHYFGAYLEKYGVEKLLTMDRVQTEAGTGGFLKDIGEFDVYDGKQSLVLSADVLDGFSFDLEAEAGMYYHSYFEGREKLSGEYGSSQVFKINGNQQWLVFSKYLYDNGFFENMSDEEMLRTDKSLAQITASMDRLNYCNDQKSYNMLINKTVTELIYGEMEQEEEKSWYYAGEESMRTSLEAAVEKLQDFCDQSVPEELRAGFRKLIDQFQTYNEDQLEGYQSFAERYEDIYQRYLDLYRDDTDESQETEQEISHSLSAPPEVHGNTGQYYDSLKAYFRQLLENSRNGWNK